MNLNDMGAGKELIRHVMSNGNVEGMGWSRKQQKEFLDKQPNPHNSKSRPSLRR